MDHDGHARAAGAPVCGGGLRAPERARARAGGRPRARWLAAHPHPHALAPPNAHPNLHEANLIANLCLAAQTEASIRITDHPWVKRWTGPGGTPRVAGRGEPWPTRSQSMG